MAVSELKRAAAARAADLIEPGMRVGLGTGSTAALFVAALAERAARGLDVVCVATSQATEHLARDLGLKLSTLDDLPLLDITVDGADEIDGQLRLIKGGGGALLREKIVATASDRMVVIADHTKQVAVLGAFPLPVEVVPFGLTATRNMIELLAGDVGCTGEITLRRGLDHAPFVTDSGHHILDCAFGRIDDPEGLDEALKLIPGVVENGLFLAIADAAVIASPDGVVFYEAEFGDDDLST